MENSTRRTTVWASTTRAMGRLGPYTSPVPRRLTMALALAGLEIGCSDRVLEIPIQAEDQSLVMISQGPAGRSALACEVAIGCPNLDLGPEDWRVWSKQ
jgi:hypothetical protein